jgi:hypothetical protein
VYSVEMETLLADLVKAIKSNKPHPDQADLPIFHPETDNANKWLQQVEGIKGELEWSDVDVLVRVGRFLLDNARRWFDNWSPDIRDWGSFKRDFSDAFPPRRNLGRLLSEAACFNSSLCNTYDVYVHKKTNLLKNLRVTWQETDLVELIVHGIKEVHVRDAAMSRDCKTVAELVAYLTVFTKKSCDTIDTGMNELNPPKRPKLELQKYDRKSVRCHNCGKLGHIRKNCRSSDIRKHSD